jgi:glycosidase
MRRPHPHLFEVSAAPWLYRLSRRHGSRIGLGNVPAREWDALAEHGADYVWLMGVWQKSAVGRQIFREREEMRAVYDEALAGWTEDDVIGSPYSIAAYEPDPDVASSWADLAQARRELDRRGMGLIVDFVPNHTGPDHAWLREHPRRYVLGRPEHVERDPDAFFSVEHDGRTLHVARGRDPYLSPWPDTAQLNYFSPDTRTAAIELLAELATHCDGVRCDMAMLLLNDVFQRTWGHMLDQGPPETELWAEARSAVPNMLWIAEAYWDTEYQLQQLGFDFAYDKRLYDRLRSGSAADVRAHLTADITYQSKLVRFLENHDEERAAAVFDGPRARAASTLWATLPGMRLLHEQQREGYAIRRPVQLRRADAEARNEALATWYDRLLAVSDHAVFHVGGFRLLDVHAAFDDSAQHLIAYEWRDESEWRLVVVNFSEGSAQGRIPLAGIDPSRRYTLRDELDAKRYERNGAELSSTGLHVVLDAMASHIFDVS